jgi:hypothetical protein
MQVTVTNSTEEDLELHISWPGCSANEQSSKATSWAQKRKKERIQDQNKKPNTISFNLCNKNWPVLKNILITCERM